MPVPTTVRITGVETVEGPKDVTFNVELSNKPQSGSATAVISGHHS